MNEIKGVTATIATAASGIIAWLPQIESLMRIGVSLAGIYAGIYAAKYWHLKSKEVKIPD